MIKKSTHIWDLIGALKSTSPVSCRNHSYPLILFTQTINQKETHDQDMFNSKKIASYPHGLRTQNPGIREVGLEPSPKRGSAKINLLRQGKQTATEKNLYNASQTHIRQTLNPWQKSTGRKSSTEFLLIASNLVSTTFLQPNPKAQRCNPIRSSRT